MNENNEARRMLMISNPDIEMARMVAAEIRPLLVRQPSWIQGAVLANLLGSFLAGQVVEGDDAATEMMRIEILHALLETVGALVAVNEQNEVVGHA